jgi:hypothetical protein
VKLLPASSIARDEWGGQRLFGRPAFIQTCVNGVPGYTDFVGPFSNAFSGSVICYEAGVATVARLLRWCCPTTVLWTIVTVSVDTVNRMRWRWLQTHILKEVFEGKPSFAYCDPSPTIQRIIRGIMAAAPTQHTTPCAVFWRMFHAVTTGCTATASSAASIPECSPPDRLCYATVTPTQPVRHPIFGVRMKAQNRPCPKPLSGKVYEIGAAVGRVVSSHSSLLSRFGWTGPARRLRLRVGSFHYSTGSLRGVAA